MPNEEQKKTITIFGAGYVGMSLAVVLAKNNYINLIDKDETKVALVNKGLPTVQDSEMQNYLYAFEKIKAYKDLTKEIFEGTNYFIICTPTDYDPSSNYFNTSSIENVLSEISSFSLPSKVVIKSTIPIGYTARVSNSFSDSEIIFSPEFLREGNAIHDHHHPSRIIVSSNSDFAMEYVRDIKEVASSEVPVLKIGSNEAESVKLFANTYLAMRVAFFNELDSFALANKLNPLDLVNGISLDSRIGSFYNNPSFGYGGYCLPKDTKQLKANYQNIPEKLITAIIDSNETRINYLAAHISSLGLQKIGFYRLAMKSGSDNFRSSAMIELIYSLKKLTNASDFMLYEPGLKESNIPGIELVKDFDQFMNYSELIIANRIDNLLEDSGAMGKVFTRDIYHRE